MNKRIVALFTAISVTLCCSCITYAAKSVSELKKDLSANQKKVEETKRQIKEKQEQQNEHKAKKDAIDLEIAGLQEDIDAIQKVIDEKNTEIEGKNTEIAQINETIVATDEQLKRRMKVMYENSSTSYLEIILAADGMSDLYTRVSVIEAIVKHDNQLIDNYNAQITQIGEAKTILEKEKQEQEEIMSMYQEKEAQIAQKRAEQEALINQLSSDIEELKRQEAEMTKADQQIEEQINAALKTTEQTKVTYSGNGKFILPLASYTRISSPYGYRIHPITKTRKLHSGIDYAAPGGTPIYAADDGVVLTSGWIRGYGYTITINHGNGIVTLYAHCSSLVAKAGEKVTKGQTVAKVGTTGNSTGNHLHFEVKVNGKAQNPASYM